MIKSALLEKRNSSKVAAPQDTAKLEDGLNHLKAAFFSLQGLDLKGRQTLERQVADAKELISKASQLLTTVKGSLG